MNEPQQPASSLPEPLSGLEVLWRPVPAMSRLVARGSLLPAFVVVALWSAVNVVAALLGSLTLSQTLAPAMFPQMGPAEYDQVRQMMSLMLVWAPIAALVLPFIGWLLLAVLLHLVSSAFGGHGPFRSTLLVTGVASSANIVLSGVQVLTSGLQYALGPSAMVGTALSSTVSLLGLGTLVWYAILVIIGLQSARGLTQGRAVGTCGVTCAGCTLLPVLLMCALMVFGMAVGGALFGSGAP